MKVVQGKIGARNAVTCQASRTCARNRHFCVLVNVVVTGKLPQIFVVKHWTYWCQLIAPALLPEESSCQKHLLGLAPATLFEHDQRMLVTDSRGYCEHVSQAARGKEFTIKVQGQLEIARSSPEEWCHIPRSTESPRRHGHRELHSYRGKSRRGKVSRAQRLR